MTTKSDHQGSLLQLDPSRYPVLLVLGITVAWVLPTLLHIWRLDSSFASENVVVLFVITFASSWFIGVMNTAILCVLSCCAWFVADLTRDVDLLAVVVSQSFRFALLGFIIYCANRVRYSLQEARRLARIDSLTGLPNRQAILEALESEVCRGRRFGRAFSIAMLDCDDFKTINDTEGHLSGDQVLQKIASALRNGTRAYDIVGRLAGDEFVMILSEASTHDVPVIIERLRASLRHELNREYPALTYSMGVVTIQFRQDHGEGSLDWRECLQRVDDAMYAAKRTGRDQTRFETLDIVQKIGQMSQR